MTETEASHASHVSSVSTQARAVLGVVAVERRDGVGVDAGRIPRSPASSASAGCASGSARRSRAPCRSRRSGSLVEHAAGGDVHGGEREPAHQLAAVGEQVSRARRARLVLLRSRASPPSTSPRSRSASTRRDRPGSPARSVKRAPRVSWMASRIHIAQRSATRSSARWRSAPSGTSSARGQLVSMWNSPHSVASGRGSGGARDGIVTA